MITTKTISPRIITVKPGSSHTTDITIPEKITITPSAPKELDINQASPVATTAAQVNLPASTEFAAKQTVVQLTSSSAMKGEDS